MPRAYKFVKKETSTQVLSRDFCENFKSTFFIEHLRATASYHRSLLLVLT